MIFNVAPTKSKLLPERIAELVDQGIVAHRTKEEPRTYLGASLIGYACDRRLGFEFFKTVPHEGFKGRTYRLFDTGHDAEKRVHEYLTLGGFKILTTRSRGGQFGFGMWPDEAHPKGRFAGHCDGIVVHSPLAEIATPAIWENKAMNDGRWQKVKSQGLKAAEPEYYVQVQIYMGTVQEGRQAADAMPNPSLWTAFNRDNGDVYYELVEFDNYTFSKAFERAQKITHARGPEYLDRITTDPADFRCKWCPYKEPCWKAPNIPAAPVWAFGPRA